MEQTPLDTPHSPMKLEMDLLNIPYLTGRIGRQYTTNPFGNFEQHVISLFLRSYTDKVYGCTK